MIEDAGILLFMPATLLEDLDVLILTRTFCVWQCPIHMFRIRSFIWRRLITDHRVKAVREWAMEPDLVGSRSAPATY